MYEISLQEKIDSSELIFKGRVISQLTKWNQDNSLIITLSTVQIETLFKGSSTLGSTVLIRTIGGEVGNSILETSSLLTLSQNDYGLFFCKNFDLNAVYDVYSSKQGFLKYVQGKVIAPFVDENQKDLEKNIIFETGIHPTSYNFNAPVPQFNLVGGGITFSPSVLSSGTSSEITICGSGFGTIGPNTTHFIAFANADDGGSPSYIAPAPSSYVSWSDTTIVVVVPTPAGTGPILVSIAGVDTYSTDTLTVPYAILNAGNDKIPLLHNLNGAGGLTWSLNTNMTGNYEPALIRAMDTWRCATGINWIVSPTPVLISAASAADGFNVIARGTVPSGVLGVCYNYYTSCNGGANWNITGQDIIFKTSASWYYSTGTPGSFQNDFESVVLHELGHAHILGHVVEISDMLFYALGSGNFNRTLTYYNIVAGTYVMNLSQGSSPCPITPIIQDFPTGCSTPILTDAWIFESPSAPDNSSCFGPTDILVDFSNLGIDTVFQLDIHWTVNGIVQLPLSWTGALGSNDEISDYLLGNYNLSDSAYTIQIWFDQVNGGQEIQTSNDTVIYSFHPIPCFPNNASIINFEVIDASVCLSSEDIIVDLVNTGINDLTSCWLYYSADGIVQDSVLWMGLIAPNDTAQSISIGTHSSFYPSIDFVTWIGSPNGVNDPYNVNDTLYQTVTPLTLRGTYSVGGSSADLPSLMYAASLLNDYGICDDVVLNIKSGSYTERIYFDSIPTPNPLYTVTIQSEANHVDSVHFNYLTGGGFPTNSLMEFDSTRNIILKDLTFHFDDGSYYEEMIHIQNGASDLLFENLFLDLSDPNYANNETGKTAFSVFGNGIVNTRPCNDLVFRNNKIEYGAHAFEFVNGAIISSGVFPTGWLIENNTVTNQNNVSLKIQGGSGTVIRGNVFDSQNTAGSSGYKQLTFTDCQDSVLLSHNHFNYNGIRDLLLFEDCDNTASTPIRIYNNSINLTYSGYTSDSKSAIKINDSDFFEVWNNTILSAAQALSSNYGYNIYASSSDSISCINNQLVNSNNVGVLLIQNTGFYSDYNNIYTNSGSYLSRVNGTSNINFAVHQTNTGLDANSTNLNPNFPNSFYLVPTNFGLNDLGTPLASITTDIVGNFRDLVTPDVGAYEFDHYNYDIGIPSSTIDNSLICSNTLTSIFVDVKNYGQMPVDSFFIYININNQQFDSVLIHQTIVPGATSSILVGGYLLTGLLENTVEAETSMPNGILDLGSYNDSFGMLLFTQLNGVFSVGGASSDFIFLNDATTYLDQNGVCGPVTFNIQDGIYNGSIVDEMVIHAYPGMSELNPVTFQSQSGDSSLVVFSMSDPVFSLQGVKYMNFNDLGFNPNSALDHAIGLDSCSHITVSHCYFEDGRILDQNIFPAGQEGIDNILIEYSHFEGGSGIYFEGLSTVNADTVTIKNCYFTDFARVALEGISNVSFDNNSIELSYSFNWYVPGIDNCSNLSVTKNQWIFCNVGFSIVDSYTENGGMNVVANNFIRSRRRPIYVSGSSDIYIVNNSINHTNDETPSAEYGVFLEDLSTLTFKNNIIHSEFNDPLIYIPIGEVVLFNPNNNLYSNNSDSLVKAYGVVPATYYSFIEWQNLGKDSLSLYGNPFYTSTTDLHVSNLILADSNAISYPFITDDFDGELRNPTHPDIGADEFNLDLFTLHDIELNAIVTPDTNDCVQADSIRISVVNHSIFPIDSFKVNTLLFNQVYDSVWIAQVILPNDTILVNLGSFNFSRNTLYKWAFEIVAPNGQQDNYFLNNASNTDYIFYDAFSIEVRESDCNGDTRLYIPQFTNASILWSTGGTTESISISSPGTYSVDVTDSQGCVYTSTVTVN